MLGYSTGAVNSCDEACTKAVKGYSERVYKHPVDCVDVLSNKWRHKWILKRQK